MLLMIYQIENQNKNKLTVKYNRYKEKNMN